MRFSPFSHLPLASVRVRAVGIILVLLASAAGLSLFFAPRGRSEAVNTVTASIRIEAPDRTIANTDVIVSGCMVTDTEGNPHTFEKPTALCALQTVSEQWGFSYVAQHSDFGLFLTEIDGAKQTDTDFWLYRVNGASPSVGLAAYDLRDGDAVLLTLGAWPSTPLNLELSRSELLVGEDVQATVTVYDDVKAGYVPAAGAKVVLDTQQYEADANGTVTFKPTAAGSYLAVAQRGADVRSAAVPLQVYARVSSYISSLPRERTQAVARATTYLEKQVKNGVIENDATTAWSAMALSAAGRSLERPLNGGVSVAASLAKAAPGDGASVTDWERQTLAVRALGKSATDWAGMEGLVPIYKNSSKGQIGKADQLNDDIFGVLALLGSGKPASDALVEDGIRTLLAAQNNDGGFSFQPKGTSATDTTAATVEALALYRSHGGKQDVAGVLKKARTYLMSLQKPDGGFAYDAQQGTNAASTAWAVQAIAALREDPLDWRKNNQTPIHYLLALQQADGSFPWMAGQPGTPLMTAYVLPALLEKALPILPQEKRYAFAPMTEGGPQVVVTDADGHKTATFFAFDPANRAGLSLAVGDTDGDGVDEIVAAEGPGAAPQVRVFALDGTRKATFSVLEAGFRGGVSIVLGDLDGNGSKEILVSPLGQGGPQVQAYDAAGRLRTSFFAYAPEVRGGVTVAAGDTDGDGDDEIVTVPNSDGGPHVRVFDGAGKPLASFFSFDNKHLRGGYNLAVGDVAGDGSEEIVLAPKAGLGAHINVFSGRGELLSGFFAFQNFIGGVQISLGDIDHDGMLEIVATPEIGQPHVRVFTKDGWERASFYAYEASTKGVGVFARLVDAGRDGTTDLLVTPGTGLSDTSKVFALNGHLLTQFRTHTAGFRGGFTVAP